MATLKTFLADEAATIALGADLARVLQPGLILFLHGDLGAGKTTLVRALVHASGHAGHVRSPTYTLAEPYALTLQGRRVDVIHFDLYRLASPDEFFDAGFRDHFNGDNVCLIEWPEKGEGALPPPDVEVFLEVRNTGREVELRGLSDLGVQCLNRLPLNGS